MSRFLPISQSILKLSPKINLKPSVALTTSTSAAVSAKQVWTPEEFFWNLRDALQKYSEQSRRFSLLVLDGFLILQKYLKPDNAPFLIQFQQELRANGIAMIIVFPKPLNAAQEKALKAFPLSGRLQTERLQVIEKGTPAVLIHPDYYSCHHPEYGGSFFFCLNTPASVLFAQIRQETASKTRKRASSNALHRT